MTRPRLLRIALPVALLWGCSGGGGSTAAIGSAPWAKFRHDVNNTGQGASIFQIVTAATVTPHVTWSQQVDAPPPTPTPGAPQSDTPAGGSPISASAAIALDGTVYVGSEGGTLLAANPDGSVKWRVTACGACGAAPALGPLMSSPTVYTLTTAANVQQTYVLVASANGTLYLFIDRTGTASIPPVCSACFRPQDVDPTVTAASFVSSPSFTTNATTFNISTIFIGAQINTTAGALYAINSDGSLRWEYPVPGPINSSPALGASNTIYVTAADGNLYAITFDGRLLWSFPVGAGFEPTPGVDTPAFISSPAASTLIYTGAIDGEILAVNPDGSSTHWRVAPADLNLSPADAEIVGSLAFGNPADTPTPAVSPTPTLTPTLAPGAPPTPTPTPVLSLASVFAVTKSGVVIIVDTTTGVGMAFPTPTASPVVPPVLSSPALSADGFLIFGDGAGRLHAIDTGRLYAIDTGTATSEEPPGWPLTLNPSAPAPIRSSPAIGADGTIYVSDDNGVLYAVRAQ